MKNRWKTKTGKPFPIVTIALIAINVIVFLFTDLFFWGSNWFMEKGAEGYDPVLHDHEYYRMITSMFLHANLDHIFNNMLLLGVLGYYIEEELGHIRFFILYFCSGLLAGGTSMVYNMTQMNLVTSIGASGAIFGLMGGLAALIWHLHREDRKISFSRLALMIFLCLYCGFASEGTDNAAHVGGFLSGIVLTTLLYPNLFRKGRNTI